MDMTLRTAAEVVVGLVLPPLFAAAAAAAAATAAADGPISFALAGECRLAGRELNGKYGLSAANGSLGACVGLLAPTTPGPAPVLLP